MQKQTLHIHGMHCSACVVLTEDKFTTSGLMDDVSVSLSKRTVEFCPCDGASMDHIIERMNPILREHGYQLSFEPERRKRNARELGIGFLIAAAFFAGFIALQKLGVVNLLQSDTVTLPFAFLIGMVASISTCMAVVGGLVLSLSATFGKSRLGIVPHVSFHAARLISFFLLGGLIGLIGGTFQIAPQVYTILGLVVAFVLLILGLNLLDVFSWTAGLQFRFPKLFSLDKLHSNRSNMWMPIIAGAATFFLPCGFTQSMQLYSLSTGSFSGGALTMLFFALGTFPVLALLSFGSESWSRSKWSGLFFKAAGFLVILFALLNLYSAFVAAGWIPPLISL